MADILTEDSSNATVGSEDVKDANNIDAITGEVDVNKDDPDNDDKRTILSEEFDLKLREGMLGDFNNRTDKVYSTIKDHIEEYLFYCNLDYFFLIEEYLFYCNLDYFFGFPS